MLLIRDGVTGSRWDIELVNTRRDPYERLSGAQFGSHVKSLVWFLVVIVAFTGFLFFLYKAKSGLSPAEYEGRIADKWVGYSPSEAGSRTYFRLLVETKTGQKLTVEVDEETYERARVGMWITKTREGTQLRSEAVPVGFAQEFLRQ